MAFTVLNTVMTTQLLCLRLRRKNKNETGNSKLPFCLLAGGYKQRAKCAAERVSIFEITDSARLRGNVSAESGNSVAFEEPSIKWWVCGRSLWTLRPLIVSLAALRPSVWRRLGLIPSREPRAKSLELR